MSGSAWWAQAAGHLDPRPKPDPRAIQQMLPLTNYMRQLRGEPKLSLAEAIDAQEEWINSGERDEALEWARRQGADQERMLRGELVWFD